MSEKIKINRATKKELIALKGIVETTADRIIKFREKGGTINSLEELREVGKIHRQDFLEQIKEGVDFDTDSKTFPIIKEEESGPIPQQKQKYFCFNVKVSGPSLGQDGQSYQGYKIKVGYKVMVSGFAGPMVLSEHTQSFGFNSAGVGTIKIAKPMAFNQYLNKNFDILINYPVGESVYNSSHQPEQGDEVEISLPDHSKTALHIIINKQAINYTGYLMEFTYRISRSSSGLVSYHEEYPIAVKDDIMVEIDKFGEIVDIDLKVISANGMPIVHINEEWKDLEDQEAFKELTIDLPPPELINTTVKLIEDVDLFNNPYADHSLIILYDLKDKDTNEFFRKMEKRFVINPIGVTLVEIEHYGQVEELDVEVKAPSGEIIGKKKVAVADLGENGEIQVKVPPQKLAGVSDTFTVTPLHSIFALHPQGSLWLDYDPI